MVRRTVNKKFYWSYDKTKDKWAYRNTRTVYAKVTKTDSGSGWQVATCSIIPPWPHGPTTFTTFGEVKAAVVEYVQEWLRADALTREANKLRRESEEIKRRYPEMIINFRRYPGSILNAYREGDLSFQAAAAELDKIVAAALDGTPPLKAEYDRKGRGRYG